MNIEEQKLQLIEEFQLFENWTDKYNYIIEMGMESVPIDEKFKTKQYTISGCQAQVWLTANYENEKVIFQADSDAIITKGIIQLLLKVVNNRTPKEIIDEDFDFLNKIGLNEHLSPTRSNGLTSMIKQIKLYALVFKTKESQN